MASDVSLYVIAFIVQGVFKVVALHARDIEDARYHIHGSYGRVQGLQVALLNEPERYADIRIGFIQEISK